MGFSQAPGLPYSKLGIPEDGDTASRAISKGKYVIWKGKNYFAKTDILQGETFVEDTNLTEIPDGALNGIADALNASFTHKTYQIDTTTNGSGEIVLNLAVADINSIISARITTTNGDLMHPLYSIAITGNLIAVVLNRMTGAALANTRVIGYLEYT